MSAVNDKFQMMDNLIRDIIKAWEALPGGTQVPVGHVERWLIDDMAPAIGKLRDYVAEEDRESKRLDALDKS